MDEMVARKLSCQLRLLNTLIISGVVIFMVLFAVAGIFVYKVVQEVREAKNSLTSLQERAEDNLEVRSELCSSSGSLSTLVQNQSNICD